MAKLATDRPVTRPDRASIRLASGVAHQINNILTVVGGHASVLLEDLNPDHPTRPSVEAISEANAAAVAVTSQLLSYAGQLSHDPRECVVADLMAHAVHAISGWTADEGSQPRVTPSIRCEPKLPNVVVDPMRFNEVIRYFAAFGSSLLRGAGDIDVEARSGRPSASGDTQVTVRTKISGPELPHVTVAGLFEPFVASQYGQPADGLRLPAASGAVRQWGGSVSARTEADALIISMTIPAAPR